MDSREPAGESTFAADGGRASKGWFRRHPVQAAFFVMVLLLVGGVWYLDHRAEKALDDRLAAIRARGEPVTVQDLIARGEPLPADQNMTVVLARAAAQQIDVGEDESKFLPYLGIAKLPPTGERCNEPVLQTSRQFLARGEEILDDLHAALTLKRGRFVVNWTTPAIQVLLPELSQLRYAANALALEICVAAHRQDRQKVERNLREMIPMMHVMDGDQTLIGALVQIAITSLMEDTIERTINLCGLSDASLRAWQAALEDAENYPDMKAAFLAERVLFLDTLQWARSAGGGSLSAMAGGTSVPAMDSGWRYIPVLPALDISAGLDQYHLLVNAVGQPDSVTVQTFIALDSSTMQLPRYCLFSRMMLPSFSRAIALWVRAIGSNRALRAAIAAERYRLARDRWPAQLDDLVPDYLDAVPLDPIDGKPIRYAIIPEGIKTWTICDDNQNADDGGDVKRLEKKRASDPPKDYGWVILNPTMRNRPAPTTSAPSSGPSP